MKKHIGKKQLILACALILVLCSTITGTLAYIAARTEAQANTFVAGTVSCEVDGNTVKNTGNVPAYIRIRVVANLVNSSGEYYSPSPTATVTGTNWEKSGNYYYYESPVDADGTTSAITVSITPVDGYTAQYQILAEAIQQLPEGTDLTGWGSIPEG